MVEEHVVAVVAGVTGYPLVPPFDPPNPVYTAVLELLARLGLDRERVGTPEWNPLGAFVREGQHVVIKPNLVSSRNFHQRYGFDDFLCCCTHPSVIRPLVDLAWRAVGPRGKISIAEAPLEGSDLVATLAALGLPHMIEVLRARAASFSAAASMSAYCGGRGCPAISAATRRSTSGRQAPLLISTDAAAGCGSITAIPDSRRCITKAGGTSTLSRTRSSRPTSS
jgi:hypothetical protein